MRSCRLAASSVTSRCLFRGAVQRVVDADAAVHALGAVGDEVGTLRPEPLGDPEAALARFDEMLAEHRQN